MSETFFPPPPRARGRGWWRRLRRLAAWLTIGSAIAAILAVVSVSSLAERAESRRLAREGRRTTCTVVSMRKTGGKSPSYYVTMRRDDRLVGVPFERAVDLSDYKSVREGSRVAYYYDDTGGVAEIERGRREGLFAPMASGLVSLGIVLGMLCSAVKLAREMRLLREGLELVTRGTSGETPIFHGELRRVLSPPSRAHSPIEVVRPGQSRGFVVLASADLARHFYPALRDVPVERLVRGEAIEPRLAHPVRPLAPEWKAWVKKRCGIYRIFFFLGLVPAAIAVFGLLAARGAPGWGTFAGIVGLFECMTVLAGMRRYWRECVLWREGEEIHAVMLGESTHKGTTSYEFAYSYRGTEYRRSVSLPADVSLLRAPSPRDAPAVTPRVLVLVDPYYPKRWTLVPTSAAPAFPRS